MPAVTKYVVNIQTIQGKQDEVIKEWQANVKLAYAQYRKFKSGTHHFQNFYKFCLIPMKPLIIKPHYSEVRLINFPISLKFKNQTDKLRYIKKHDVRIKFLPVLYANLNPKETDTIGTCKPVSGGDPAEVLPKRN